MLTEDRRNMPSFLLACGLVMMPGMPPEADARYPTEQTATIHTTTTFKQYGHRGG
jgi:hypothetical protein